MGANVTRVRVPFSRVDGREVGTLTLFAPPAVIDSIAVLDPKDAALNCEEAIQIYEGTRYEYETLPEDWQLALVTGVGVIRRSSNPRLRHCGTLELGSYVGRLGLLLTSPDGSEVGIAAIEVCARKLGYRDDLRVMIEEITEHAVELAFELRSPTTLRAVPDPSSETRALYQQFAFLNALLSAKPFKDALHYISIRPHERLDTEMVPRELRRGFKPLGRSLREIAKSPSRFPVPAAHPLRRYVPSLPTNTWVRSGRKSEDNPENRFVRFALETFSQFLESLVRRIRDSAAEEHLRLARNAERLIGDLQDVLSNSVLANVSPIRRIPLDSPVLQRKEGYREIFEAWLKFDLAARLVWEGGSDVYDLGRRDVATLYEYWVFFKLLDLFSTVFSTAGDFARNLLEETGDHLGLRLKTGRNIVFRGTASRDGVLVHARLDYNRTFVRHAAVDRAGSWTQRMRPDYTLTLWLGEADEATAEANGEVVHVHFDAKYRIDSLEQMFGNEEEVVTPTHTSDKKPGEEQRSVELTGTYKRADLLKMHAYRDAIRRSYGAYILYPGSADRQWTGFHEILPGLGAFVLRPSGGQSQVLQFVEDLVKHVAGGSIRRDLALYSSLLYSGSYGQEK